MLAERDMFERGRGMGSERTNWLSSSYTPGEWVRTGTSRPVRLELEISTIK
jgi:hypothetical protein